MQQNQKKLLSGAEAVKSTQFTSALRHRPPEEKDFFRSLLNLIAQSRSANLRSPQIFLRVFSSYFPPKYFRNASRNTPFSPLTAANNVIEE